MHGSMRRREAAGAAGRWPQGPDSLPPTLLHHRWVRARAPGSRHVAFLVRYPSRQAMQHARERVRELTARERFRPPVEQIVRELNWFLRGWAGYFRYGNSARAFDKVRLHAISRLARFVAKRHGRSARWGWQAVVYQSPDLMGIYNLNGIVVAPRPIWGWREKPNAVGEGRR